jgi:hypothetical protein
MFSHAEGTLGKKAHDVGQVSGNSLVKYREWMGVNLVVRKGIVKWSVALQSDNISNS